MSNLQIFALFRYSLATLLALAFNPANAQTERWYQIEISIFTNEYSNLERELWPAPEPDELQIPGNAVQLRGLMDFLDLDDWSVLDPQPGLSAPEPDHPQPLTKGEFRLPDFARDAFLQLPVSQSNFSETNRTLDQSAAHRLLANAAWRQPVRQASDALPIRIQAGRQTGDQGEHELEGSITIHFNQSGDRVVLKLDLWFNESGSGRTLTLAQSRDMRSNEFHYLDHPAAGILVMVFAYDRPPMPLEPVLQGF